MCNKDCWNCELEGCPYTLEISEELDTQAFNLMSREEKKRYYTRRYQRTEQGKKKMKEAQARVRAKNGAYYNKMSAKYAWIKDNTKRKGKRPTDKEIEEWSRRYDEKKRAKQCS